jgi:hypothetical protein
MEKNPSSRFVLLDHIGYFLLFAALPLILIVAHSLSPSAQGLGTHTGLGLPPCGFYSIFHKPCPSCGMTTSFALMMHGNIIAAVKAQPAGVFLFLTTFFVWATLPYYYFKKKKKLLDLLELPFLLPILVSNLILILGVWIIRLFI